MFYKTSKKLIAVKKNEICVNGLIVALFYFAKVIFAVKSAAIIIRSRR